MPFTASHVVAILPVARFWRPIPFSALAIGSMIPDLPLFLPIVTYGQTHDPTQVLRFCLPLGIATFVIFQLFLKIPMLSLFPRPLQDRVVPFASAKLQLSFAYWLLVVLGIVIGAYSHIVWDSFTHPNRWGTRVVAPGLNQIVDVFGHQMPIYKILQHLSSVIGLMTLGLLAASLLIRSAPANPPRDLNARLGTKFLASLLLVMTPIGVFLYLIQLHYAPSEIVGLTITMSGAALALALGCYALYFHFTTRGKFIEP